MREQMDPVQSNWEFSPQREYMEKMWNSMRSLSYEKPPYWNPLKENIKSCPTILKVDGF